MMKKTIFFAMIYLLIFFVSSLYAEEKPEKAEEALRPGMERVEFGNYSIIVPKGAKIERRGNLITIEDIGNYMVRNLAEIEKKFTQLQAKQEELRKELDKLKEALSEIEKSKDSLGAQRPGAEKAQGK